jgi:hypothetical protein
VGGGGRRTAILVAALVTAFLGLGGVARAMGEPDSGAFNEFKLEGSNGYSILVWGYSEKGYRHGGLLLLVSRGGRRVMYQAPAHVTDTRVDADLGNLGEIDVTFQPSGKVGVAHPSCEPKSADKYDEGTYVGKIAFHGEEGYTAVEAERAAFTYRPVIDIGCPYSATTTVFGSDLPGAELEATAREDGGVVGVQVNQDHPGARVTLGAGIVERRGKVRITRGIETAYGAGAFHFAPDLSSASFTPPAPFSGSARYRAQAKTANRWIGNLTVDFPGHSNVTLTGAKFRTHLRHAKLIKETFYSERRGRLNFPTLR